jgi:hypothetical protein
MKEIVSGNIVADVNYQVIGGTSVTYNSVVVNAGNYFIGVSGVTTYTQSGGSKVYEASDFLGTVLGLGEIQLYYNSYTVTERKQNENINGFNDWGYKIKLNSKNDSYIGELSGQTSNSAPLNYSELNNMLVGNNNISADKDADGVITNFKIQRIN